jgi:ribonuclease P protein component
VTREGKRIRTEHLEVRAAASPLHHPRVGFIVPKHKQSGVARNQLKRRLREIVRTSLLPALPPSDVVVRARPEAYGASYDALAAELARAATKLPALLSR